jgi:hypothetical protein
MILDPIHYLATLGRKPGALDHSPVYRDWKLPVCFPALRTDLEQHYGAEAAARRYVRVLQLLGEHPLERVRRAVEDCRRAQVISAEAIVQKTRSLAVSEQRAGASSRSTVDSITVSQAHVPLPDLSLFNQLLGNRVSADDVHDEAGHTPIDDGCLESQSTMFFA